MAQEELSIGYPAWALVGDLGVTVSSVLMCSLWRMVIRLVNKGIAMKE